MGARDGRVGGAEAWAIEAGGCSAGVGVPPSRMRAGSGSQRAGGVRTARARRRPTWWWWWLWWIVWIAEMGSVGCGAVGARCLYARARERFEVWGQQDIAIREG